MNDIIVDWTFEHCCMNPNMNEIKYHFKKGFFPGVSIYPTMADGSLLKFRRLSFFLKVFFSKNQVKNYISF